MKNIFLNKETWLNILKIKEGEIPETLLIYGSWHYSKIFPLLDRFITKKKETGLPNLFLGKVKDRLVAYAVTYGPTMSGEIAHCFGVLGTKKIILVGSCGALSKNKNPILISSKSFRKDCFSDWYLPKKLIPAGNRKLIRRAEKLLGKNGVKTETGYTITVTNMLMENNALISKLRKKNIKGIDLETSTIYSVCEYFNMQNIALLLKSENLIDNTLTLPRGERIKIRDVLVHCAIQLV